MRMNKYVPVLLMFAIVFSATQLLTWSTAEAAKYPRLRADAGDFQSIGKSQVKLDVLIAKVLSKNLLTLNGNGPSKWRQGK